MGTLRVAFQGREPPNSRMEFLEVLRYRQIMNLVENLNALNFDLTEALIHRIDGRVVDGPPCARHRRLGRTGVPTYPDAPNIAVLPNHVTMPIGVAIVESQIEFLRKFGEGGRFETDTCTQCVQVFDGAVVPSIRMLSQDLGWLRHFRSRESHISMLHNTCVMPARINR